MTPLPGLYRAMVVENVDPAGANRLRVSIPSVFDAGETWALPCRAPDSIAIPAVGQAVWVAFEGGDPRFPVWVGVYG